MKIYIASSWKHKHGVEMLTSLIRQEGHEVVSWIENCSKEGVEGFAFEEWVNTPEAEECFRFDTDGATTCDLFIYYGAAGMDACCEMGAAWVKGIEIIGMYSKGESLGLMRKMVWQWADNYRDVVDYIKQKTDTEKKSTKPEFRFNKNLMLTQTGLNIVDQGSFHCLQCATLVEMNTNCLNLMNAIGKSMQTCPNCEYTNHFDVTPILGDEG